MLNRISFISANFVARQLNYHMTQGWRQGDKATNDYFRPLDTYAARFEEILRDVQTMGFAAIDIWLAHLHWSWATAEHIAVARDLLKRYNLVVPSLAGGFGRTRAEFVAACKLAQAMEVEILAGMTPLVEEDRAFVVDTLQQYGVKLALENHPEKTPEEMLAKIDDSGSGRIGTAVDTGWYGTQGYNAAEAIKKLDGHIFIVHLKDVLEPGGHHTCRYGQGCVPIETCVNALKEMGYRGYYGVEHEPEEYDPTEDCIANWKMLREWLAQ
ncbi:MAG: sugar phosphate isomerase/epimerase [Anaerolineae bacterium]|nr:sugar phosphate isomerase/epimerase [Anaerolineae bacterium]